MVISFDKNSDDVFMLLSIKSTNYKSPSSLVSHDILDRTLVKCSTPRIIPREII